MPRPVATLLACVLALAGLGACGAPPESEAHRTDPSSVPYGLLDPDVTPLLVPATGPNTTRVSLCFVRGDKLAVVETDLDATADLRTVVDALVKPPESAGADLRTAVGPPTLVDDVRLRAGTADVDLRPSVADLAGDEQLVAIAQLVCTLTGQPGVGTVSFTLDGVRIEVPRGDGSLASSPVSRDDYRALLP